MSVSFVPLPMTTVPPATVLIAGPAGLTASFSFSPLSVAVLLLAVAAVGGRPEVGAGGGGQVAAGVVPVAVV